METFGSFTNEEWECLNKLFAGDQDLDHFFNNGLSSSDQQDLGFNFNIPFVADITNSSFIEDHEFCNSSENINPNFYHCLSQETSNNAIASYNSNIHLPTNGAFNYDQVHVIDENINISSLLAQVLSTDVSVQDESVCMTQDDQSVPISDQHKHMALKRKLEMEDKVNEEKANENPKKKARVTRVNKNKKKVQPKKKQKVMDATENINENDAEIDNKKAVANAPIASSSSCSSEDDLNGGSENSTWKTRAGRGAATDPQSLYARKRRERINERLKVLQTLVPNGTKVDISTMLEEAVQYVKFLQLQIKLLSSDEMWMYAPIAYNGMDMGLYQKLSQS